MGKPQVLQQTNFPTVYSAFWSWFYHPIHVRSDLFIRTPKELWKEHQEIGCKFEGAQNPLLCSRRQSVCEYKFRGWCYYLFRVLAGLNFSSAAVNFSVSFSQKLTLEISSGVRLTWSSAMLVILNLTRGLLNLSSMQLAGFFSGITVK